MFESLRFGLRAAALLLADGAVTHPLFSWTWSGSANVGYTGRLTEFRPSDDLTVVEMMEGKYLLGGKLADTGGLSPFAVDSDPDEWFSDLHSFGWLRHFPTLRDTGQRRFARTLVLDWIGRYSKFDRDAWGLFVTARRVLNWLKNYDLLIEEASPDNLRTINRSLSSQIQSLKIRAPLAIRPRDQLMVAIALAGAAMSETEKPSDLEGIIEHLSHLLDVHFDADGLHLSRNPLTQVQILSELIPVYQLLDTRRRELAGTLAPKIEAMHRALERLVLGTREPVFANGCGQVPVELVLAIAAQSGARSSGSGLCGGYGVLVDGLGKVVADSGRVPPLDFAADAHAGALSFEFSSGSTLVVGNCGPAPAQLPESRNLFRHSSAHSAPTIDDISSARIGEGGWLGNRVRARGPAPEISCSPDENALEIRCAAYRQRYGLDLVRRLTLMGGGQTLVGQDRLAAAGRRPGREGEFSIRFHLAPGVTVERNSGEDLIRLVYRNGEVWSFLWEGADAQVEDSVRHSAHYGLNRTRQIVLTGAALPEREIAWVFTRQ